MYESGEFEKDIERREKSETKMSS
jgi:hypothetical protein